MVNAYDQAVMDRALGQHLPQLIEDLLTGKSPSFYEFTLEVAAIVPSTLPNWSISISETTAYVRGERSMTRGSPARDLNHYIQDLVEIVHQAALTVKNYAQTVDLISQLYKSSFSPEHQQVRHWFDTNK